MSCWVVFGVVLPGQYPLVGAHVARIGQCGSWGLSFAASWFCHNWGPLWLRVPGPVLCGWSLEACFQENRF